MKNDDDFIHLPELYIKLSALKKHLQKTYKLNINPMKNSDKNVNWSDLNKNLNAGYDDEKMAMISCDIIHEYAVKLDKVVKEDTELEDWVKSKIAKTEQMMASVKHALIGIEKYDHGGELFKQQLLHIGKYAQAIIEALQDGTELMSWMESNLAVCADHMDNVYHHLDYKMGNRAKDLDKMKDGGGIEEKNYNSEELLDTELNEYASRNGYEVLRNVHHATANKNVPPYKTDYFLEKDGKEMYVGTWDYESNKGSVSLAGNKMKNGGGVSDYGVNYNIVFEKPDSDMAWKETINASSEKEARAEFKKKHPTCTILNIFEAYANGGGVKLRELDDVDLVLKLENKSDFDLMNNEYGGDFPALNPRTFEFFVNFDNVDSVDAKEINEYESYIIDNLKELGIKNYYFDRVINKFNYANGGGVDENDEYELRVDLTGKDVNGDLHWAIEYRKKGYKKPLFSNPFKKSEFDWTPLIPKGMRGVSISIGEYQETEVDTWNPLKKKYETQAERLNEKYGIIDPWGHMPYWNWPYDNKTKEYKLRVYSYYDRKDLTESIAILLSANNDKFLKEILRRKLEILQEIKEEEVALKNYKKPSYFANGGGIGKEYKLRAEGINDFINFLGTGIYFDIKWFKVEITSGPDVIVTFSTNLSLKQIKSNLEQVQDSHVMLDTLKPVNQYTGERYANGGNVGRDAMFRSQEPHEQRYDRKREYKEYKKEGWLANDWFDNGGGVGNTDYKSLLAEERRLYAEYNKVKADYDREYKEGEFDSLLAQEYKQKMEMLEGKMMEVNNDLLYLQTHGIEESFGGERMANGGGVKLSKADMVFIENMELWVIGSDKVPNEKEMAMKYATSKAQEIDSNFNPEHLLGKSTFYANGGGVGYFKSGYTLKGRKGKYWIDDVEGRVTKDRYFEKEEDAIAEIDLLSRFKKLKNEQRVKGPSMENLMEADRYYAEGGEIRNIKGNNFSEQIANGRKFKELIQKVFDNQSGEHKHPIEFITAIAKTKQPIVKSDGKNYIIGYSYKGTISHFDFLDDSNFVKALDYVDRPAIRKFEDGAMMNESGVENDPLKKKGDIVTDGNNFYEVLREYTAYNSGADQYASENEGAALPAGLEYGYAYTALKLRNLETGVESSGSYSNYEKIKREDVEGLIQAKLVKDADDKIKEQKRKAEQDAERIIWQAKMEEAERVRNLSKGDIELAKELISDWKDSIIYVDYSFNHHNELTLEVLYTYDKYLGETEPSEEYFITFKVDIEQTSAGYYDPGDRWTPPDGEDAQYKFSLDRVYIEKNGVQVYEGKVEFVELFDKSVIPKINDWKELNQDVDK